MLSGCVNLPNQTTQSVPTTNQNESTNQDTSTLYSLVDIGKHNSADDCWMAIDGKVYDATSYVNKHPNPDILKGCGQDATAMYQEERKHAGRRAKADLPTLQVGELTR
jgi:cytochrome b involved in lipid metabolism